VHGRLDPAKIQAVVRGKFADFRACLGPDEAEGTNVACVVDIFAALHFPAPDAGVVDVIYPLKLEAR
jgi:hypothetical protein